MLQACASCPENFKQRKPRLEGVTLDVAEITSMNSTRDCGYPVSEKESLAKEVVARIDRFFSGPTSCWTPSLEPGLALRDTFRSGCVTGVIQVQNKGRDVDVDVAPKAKIAVHMRWGSKGGG